MASSVETQMAAVIEMESNIKTKDEAKDDANGEEEEDTKKEEEEQTVSELMAANKFAEALKLMENGYPFDPENASKMVENNVADIPDDIKDKIQDKISKYKQSKTPKCYKCGDEMKMESSHCDWCGDEGGYICYGCSAEICVECLKLIDNFIKEPIKKMHDTKLMYYIYNNNEIGGPYSCDQVISLYICNKFKQNKIYIMSASRDEYRNWNELIFPEKAISTYPKENRSTIIGEMENKNIRIKQKFPDLYKHLVENVLTGTLLQIASAPISIPTDVQEAADTKKSFIMIVGRVLALIIFIIMLLHILPFALIGVCYMYIVINLINTDDKSDRWHICVSSFFYFLFYFSMIASPIIVTCCILYETDIYNEIQSWQIAYIVWGTSAYIMNLIYSIATVLRDQQKQDRLIKVSNNIISYIVGIDFGQLDLMAIIKEADIEQIITMKDVGVILLLLMPPLAGLLPAAIAGFIANYILQEKFELKCRENIVNENICFDSEYGCCQVISSHNWENTYVFMGGLASNILATWAVIRICGYLLINAYPHFSAHAKRTK